MKIWYCTAVREKSSLITAVSFLSHTCSNKQLLCSTCGTNIKIEWRLILPYRLLSTCALNVSSHIPRRKITTLNVSLCFQLFIFFFFSLPNSNSSHWSLFDFNQLIFTHYKHVSAVQLVSPATGTAAVRDAMFQDTLPSSVCQEDTERVSPYGTDCPE
jgi:hypothetical protein